MVVEGRDVLMAIGHALARVGRLWTQPRVYASRLARQPQLFSSYAYEP